MHYQTTFRTNPSSRNGRKLKNYVAGNSIAVVDSVGMQPSEQQLEQFVRAASSSAETRQHTISLMNEYETEQLIDWAESIADETLDGEYIIGIHDNDESAPHIHIAEIHDEARGTDFDIFEVRDSLEKHIPDPPAW